MTRIRIALRNWRRLRDRIKDKCGSSECPSGSKYCSCRAWAEVRKEKLK